MHLNGREIDFVGNCIAELIAFQQNSDFISQKSVHKSGGSPQIESVGDFIHTTEGDPL